MRIHVLSDLHLEFADFTPPQVEADVIVFAGDTHLGERGVRWAAKAFPGRQLIYLLGNHEYYGKAMPKLADKLKVLGHELGVHVLERDSVEIAGVRFLGTTLWTDFMLSPNRELGMITAGLQMVDYKKIRVSPTYRRLRPLDTAGIHATAIRWLRQMIAESNQPTVIVTHHAPSARSLRPGLNDQWLNGAYASDLDEFVAASGARLWIHGHTHYSVDYEIGSTRIVSNQRGYPDEPAPGFRPGFVVEV